MRYEIKPIGDCYIVVNADGENVGGPYPAQQTASARLATLLSKDRDAESAPRTVTRKCMACPTEFESEGAHHRLCNEHRRSGSLMLEGGSTGHVKQIKG